MLRAYRDRELILDICSALWPDLSVTRNRILLFERIEISHTGICLYHWNGGSQWWPIPKVS